MSFSSFQTYIRTILTPFPRVHWAIICILALALTTILIIRKKWSVYGSIVLGITVFIGLFLLDTAVGIRYFGFFHHTAGFDLKVDIIHFTDAGEFRRVEILSNIAVFVPFGFFLSEFLSTTKRFSVWHRIGYVTLAAFGLSLCIECLQLILRVGLFELTDLVMHTVGAFLGAGLALLGRKVLRIDKK